MQASCRQPRLWKEMRVRDLLRKPYSGGVLVAMCFSFAIIEAIFAVEMYIAAIVIRVINALILQARFDVNPLPASSMPGWYVGSLDALLCIVMFGTGMLVAKWLFPKSLSE